jgi:hypothetical protein
VGLSCNSVLFPLGGTEFNKVTQREKDMTISEQLEQAIPVALAARAKEVFRLLESVPKFTWPAVPATGDIFEHIR